MRDQSHFSNDSSVAEDISVVGRMSLQPPSLSCVRSSSAQSCSNWPFDINSPKIDYCQSSAPIPKFKKHKSPTSETGGSSNGLQNWTTSGLDASTFAKIETRDPRTNVIAASYRALVKKEGEATTPVAATTAAAASIIRHKHTQPDASLKTIHSAPPRYS